MRVLLLSSLVHNILVTGSKFFILIKKKIIIILYGVYRTAENKRFELVKNFSVLHSHGFLLISVILAELMQCELTFSRGMVYQHEPISTYINMGILMGWYGG